MVTRYDIKVADPDPTMNPEQWIRNLLQGILDHFIDNNIIKSVDKIGLTLTNKSCETEPVYISIRPLSEINIDVILEQVMQIFDSNKDFFLNGHLEAIFDHITMPSGSGDDRITRAVGESNASYIEKKPSFLKYTNKKQLYPRDEYCLPYALVIGRACIQGRTGVIPQGVYRKFQRTFKTLRKAAEDLCREAGVVIENLRGGCGFEEVKKFQVVMSDFQIRIFDRYGLKPLYTDPLYNDTTLKLNVSLHNNHYHFMRSLAACNAVKYVCTDCFEVAQSANRHNCKYACLLCHGKPRCVPSTAKIHCDQCNRNFYGDECFRNHLRGPSPLCAVVKNCLKCNFKLEYKHDCKTRYCVTCEKKVPRGTHLCYMPKYRTAKDPAAEYLYVMYDFEAQQYTPLSPSEPHKIKHEPNLCTSQNVCTSCMTHDDISKTCKECGVREHIH